MMARPRGKSAVVVYGMNLYEVIQDSQAVCNFKFRKIRRRTTRNRRSLEIQYDEPQSVQRFVKYVQRGQLWGTVVPDGPTVR